MLPLAGVTVIAVEQAVAAPFATRQLADLGARVIKIERPQVGDFARGYDATVRGMASHFVWLNRSKQSLTLDLKRPEAQGVLRGLLATADVFIHNLAPGAIDRLGFGAAALRASVPRLITCEISGYWSTRAYAHKKAYDLLIQSEAGLLSITGTNDTPSKVGISIADIAAGMYAYTAVLTALFTREKTGAGAAIEVSLFDALGEWMGYPMYYAAYGPEAPRRTGAHHASIAPYGPVTTADGQVVYLGIENEGEWRRFCEVVLEDPALSADPRFGSNAKRIEHRELLDGLIASRVATVSAGTLIDRLERAQIANARMNTLQQFLAHPQLAARSRWREVDSPAGPLRALVPPATVEGVEPVMGPIPDVGQHTDQ